MPRTSAESLWARVLTRFRDYIEDTGSNKTDHEPTPPIDRSSRKADDD
jgi:hypothetical protein